MHITQFSPNSSVNTCFRLFVGLVLFALCTVGVSKSALASAQQAAHHQALPVQNQPESSVAEDASGTTTEILVGLRDSQLRAASSNLASALTSIAGDVVSIEEYDTRGIASVSCEDTSVAGLRLTVRTDDPDAVAATLAQHPEVLFAVPNAPVFAADRLFAPKTRPRATRPHFTSHWQNSEQNSPRLEIDDPLYSKQQWYMDQINAEAALEQVFNAQQTGASTADPIIVAIIDSGIDAAHPEFTGRLLQGHNFLRPTELPDDDYGHGTHVAGLIGAAVNNGLGIAGISPNVTILPYKTLDQDGGGTIDNVVKAICRAVDDGADIINLSLTSPAKNTEQYTAVFDYARDRGVMMIAAAGNFRQTRNQWPARLEGVMAIAATNTAGKLASYSSPGDSIDMAAPGGEFDVPLLSTWPRNVLCNGAAPTADDAGGTYCDSIGTSMSAALVSGVAAILKEFHPDASVAEITDMLKRTTQPLTEDVDSVGSGLLDAERAVVGAMSSQLVVAPVFDSRTVKLASPPYVLDVSIVNPSFEVLNWSVADPGKSWVGLSLNDGLTRFGSPSNLTVTVRPQDLAPGNYGTPITIVGRRLDGTLLFQNIQILLQVDSENDTAGQLIVTQEPDEERWFAERPHAITSSVEQSIIETVEFKNVGQEELSWTLGLDDGSSSSNSWVRVNAPISNTLAFSDSLSLPIEIFPNKAATGQNRASITLSATRGDGSVATATANIIIHKAPMTLLPLFISSKPQ